ncbi:hypothetical protein GRZ55_01305 [Chelativorans sp. ZYF759]|uniref:DUF6634 family protein n=1 Tax=Chelativorans sp. ZYF759 TaxID=2692213 RepID=UPI00145F7251|nr:DUF6634 family protein [Chelativorans sp. ZYF759]NMG37872.1 hypothetical protein [Chelativorans sp. ZYF759]
MVLRFTVGRPAQSEELDAELKRLCRLVSDLARIERGVPVEDLERPVALLDSWVQGIRPAPCLMGLTTDHPTLPGEGRSIVTSDLLLMSDDGHWARTRSNWYRLGRPAGRGRDDA